MPSRNDLRYWLAVGLLAVSAAFTTRHWWLPSCAFAFLAYWFGGAPLIDKADGFDRMTKALEAIEAGRSPGSPPPVEKRG